MALYDIYAEREACPIRNFAVGVTLEAATALIEAADYETADGYEGYEFVAVPATDAARLAAGLGPGLPAGSLMYTDDWEPID